MEHSGFELSALALAGGIAIVGFYTGHIAKRFLLPSLIGYMILGVLIGPSAFGVLDKDTMESMGFITEVALGFVAFSIGAELSLIELRRLGRPPAVARISHRLSTVWPALFPDRSIGTTVRLR